MSAFTIQSIVSAGSQPDHKIDLSLAPGNFALVWIREGKGQQMINNERYPLDPDLITCIGPDQQHRFRFDPGVKGTILSFNVSFLCQVDTIGDMIYDLSIIKYLSQYPGNYPVKAKEEMHEILVNLVKEFSGSHPLRSELLRRYLRIFLIYLVREFGDAHPAVVQQLDNGLVQRFFQLLERQYKQRRSVTEYAGELCVTANYLNEVVKKYSGFSAGHIIRHRIVREAKSKAVSSNFSMKETAYYLGFSDMAHFSKFFKNVSGMNYSDFRRSSRDQLVYR